MRKLKLTIGIAILALAFPIANAGAQGSVFVSERAPRAASAAYEDTEFDRDLPVLAQPTQAKQRVAGAPHEDTLADRGWPVLPQSMSGAGEASFGATVAPVSPFDRDYGFIAPAQ